VAVAAAGDALPARRPYTFKESRALNGTERPSEEPEVEQELRAAQVDARESAP
jgi:hypothetical protein